MLNRYINTPDFLPIPVTGNMFFVNIEGVVKDSEGNVLPITLNKQGKKVVWMPYWNGWDYYQVATLVALTFKPVHMPFSYWNKIDVLYLDGNLENVHASNLIWKFPIGLESRLYPGYAFIPGFSRYVVNKEGDVINVLAGNKLQKYKDERNYQSITVITDTKEKRRVGIHRLVALAWLDYPVNADDLHVNHLNGKPSVNKWDNLEWTTPQGNTFHAIRTGLFIKQKNVYARNEETGEISSYVTQNDACRELGLPRGAIAYLFSKSLNERKPYKGYFFWKYGERDHFPEIDYSEHNENVGREMDPRVMVRNAETGEISIYESTTKCAEALDITTDRLLYRIARHDQPVWGDGTQVQRYKENAQWREVGNFEQEKALANERRSVLMKNIRTGEIKEYESARQCAFDLGLSELTVAVRLREQDQKVYPPGYQFKLKLDPTPWREVKDIDAELENRHYPTPVSIKNILTGEIMHFSSLGEAAAKTPISEAVLIKRQTSENAHPYLQYEINYDSRPWRVYTEEEMKMYQISIDSGVPFRGRGYSVEDIETKEVKLYTREPDLSKDLDVSKATVCSLARRNGVFRNKYRLSYFFQNNGTL